MKTENQKPENSKDSKDVNNNDGNVIALTLLGVLAGLMGLAS